MCASSDEALLVAWQEGDSSAGDELLDRHFPALLRFFRNKAGASVEDLVQETFFECVRSVPRNRRASSFRSFLFGVAHNVLKRHYDRETRSRTHDGGHVTSLQLPDPDRSPTSLLAHAHEERLLLRALQQLPIDAQVLLELVYWENLNSTEIAEVLGIPAGTVRTRSLHARRRLRAEIERLAESPQLASSTIHGFETWIERIRILSTREA